VKEIIGVMALPDTRSAAQILGQFAAELAFADIPPTVIEHAKACIIDTTAVAVFGSTLPWSRIVADYATRYGAGGPCSILGSKGARVHAPSAALANGVYAHAFEQDGARDPSVGSHPGAALLPAVLAACEETGADGRTAITAFVVGCEVLLRIAVASHHSRTPPEKLGFHAPGITGCYGAAAAAGRVFGLGAEQMTHALGIAGSLSSGLLAFTKSRQGGMVKRLHLGRAAESGILAARLASIGYTGPETVLEGEFGFLQVYCQDGAVDALTADLRRNWETLHIGMKRYACHMNAQTPVQLVRELMTDGGFTGSDVGDVWVEGVDKLVSHHDISEPGDVMQAQYSVPFCVALAMYRDPDDPASFNASALEDEGIRGTCRKVKLRAFGQKGRSNKSAGVRVQLKDGREFEK